MGLKYNLASIYKTGKKVELANLKRAAAQHYETLAFDNARIMVHNAFNKFTESINKLKVYEKGCQLAEENYRIINNRYLNNQVLITEMVDATNTKINSELQVVNARLDVIYTYYKLQREIGKSLSK